MIYCLMASGLPFSDAVADLLLESARRLHKEKKSFLRIKTEDCEGRVETEGKHASMGTVSGQVFEAEIDTEEGSTTVHFIVRTQDMKGPLGRWTPWMSRGDANSPHPMVH